MREVDDAQRARVSARHRGDRAAARRRRGARQRRLLAALVRPERERLQGASGGRGDACARRRLIARARRAIPPRARPSCASSSRRHAHAYYVLDAPTIPDAEYDALFQELQAIEAAHPGARQRRFADPARARRGARGVASRCAMRCRCCRSTPRPTRPPPAPRSSMRASAGRSVSATTTRPSPTRPS